MNLGKLFIFEGPDGTGKTTLSKRLADYLNSFGIRVKWFSFPGTKEGTLGKLVYGIHHAPTNFNINELTQTSLQILHIAAHVDAIETQILPVLKEGIHVILDRFWWSALVYGTANGVPISVLNSIIQVERLAWGPILPHCVISLTTRKRNGNVDENFKDLRRRYCELAVREGLKYRIFDFTNKKGIDEAVKIIARETANELFINKGISQAPSPKKLGGINKSLQVFTKLSPAKTTIVYDTFWQFAAERQEIFYRRLAGKQFPWTDDPILQQHKFTNAYRAADRTSQYLISEVIYSGSQEPEEVFFRTLLFKFFNKIDTWRTLLRAFQTISYRDFKFGHYDSVLLGEIEQGRAIYSAAYIMPSGGRSPLYSRKHQMHLKLLELMIKERVASRIAEAPTMAKAFDILRLYPTIGDFLAYQYITDLNYSNFLNFKETEFTVPGPGARDGIRKCFSDLGGLTETDMIKIVCERQEIEFRERGKIFKTLWGRPLKFIDCQNLFCEVDKYSRVKHPDIPGRTGRSRIKQKYCLSSDAIKFWFPPKWNLNHKIKGRLDGSSF